MGGEGAISGMITSIKYNRNLLSRHKQKRKEAFNVLKDTSKTGGIKLDNKDFPEEELEKFKMNVREERRKSNLKLALFSIIFITFSVIAIILFLQFLGL